ncbi:MAG: hypothetical protein K0R01_246, partial [Mycobacterium sp.]|nr:hypothetical protein [Mycobacterium sp.]
TDTLSTLVVIVMLMLTSPQPESHRWPQSVV